MTKPITVRFNNDLEIQLRALATFDRVTLAEEIREAVELLLEARRNDPEYRERVRVAFTEARKTLQELEGTEAIREALGNPFEKEAAQQKVAARAADFAR